MEKKIKVTSTINAIISMDIPELNFRRTWKQKGAVNFIEEAILEEAFYDPGIEYMFTEGILFIDDANMDFKIRVGLEEENTKEATKILPLTDKDKERYLVNLPYNEFKALLNKLSLEQLQELALYASSGKIEVNDIRKINALTESSKTDVMKIIMDRKEEEEINLKTKEEK